MKNKSLEKLSLYAEQAQNEQVKCFQDWMFAKGHTLTSRELDLYSVGFAQGYRDAIKTIQLHDLK